MNLTEANFSSEVMEADVPVLVDFHAPWCGPCRSLTPILDRVEQELGDSIKIGKVNVDQNQELAREHQISSIPVLLFVKGGKVVDRLSGLQPEQVIKDKLTALI